MRFLLSGQAAAALSLQAPHILFRLDEEPSFVGERYSYALRYFDGCSDLREITTLDADTIANEIERAWSSDRSLRLFLLGLQETDTSERFEILDAVQELIAEEHIFDDVRNRLCVSTIPVLIEINELRKQADSLLAVARLIDWLFSSQDAIRTVLRSFFSAIDSMGYAKAEADRLLHQMAVDRVLAPLVGHVRDGDDLAFETLRLANLYARHRPLVTSWLTGLGGGQRSASISLPRAPVGQSEQEDDEPYQAEAVGNAGRRIFERVRAQQRAIVEHMKRRDIEAALSATESLVADQRSNSNDEQVGMTLCVLAQEAKEHGLPDLQLTWAKWATEVSPSDPKTFGHLADAYIGRGDLAYASEAADRIAANNGIVFAEGCRARILRAMGKPDEAREMYLRAFREHDVHPEAEYLLSGAADTLREMNRVNECVSEYHTLTEQFPLSANIWTGYGLALLAAGRSSDALKIFNTSLKHNAGGGAGIGRANAHRQSGDFSEARQIYTSVLSAYPFNEFALCGIAEMLLAEGKVEPALSAFEEAALVLPHSALAVTGLARAKFELGHFEDALAIYQKAAKDFSNDEKAARGVVRCLNRLGRLNEALRNADTFIDTFVFSLDLKADRAQLLARKGETLAALAQVEGNLEVNKRHSFSLSVKAEILIGAGRYSEALSILPKTKPTSRQEWRLLTLRCLANVRSGYSDLAVRELKSWIEKCTFFHERRSLRSILSSILLSKGKFRQARDQVVNYAHETENVIAFRILAKTNKRRDAVDVYSAIRKHEKDPMILSFAEEVARRGGFVREKPRQSDDWLDKIESIILLSRAA